MGRQHRESRQARRAKARRGGRAAQAQHRRGGSNVNRWSIIGGAAVIVAAIAILGTLAVTQGQGTSASATPTPQLEVLSQTIHGIECNYGEQVTYHVHAHLAIFDAGKPVTVPAGIGINTDHDCLYWLHTHNTDGILHIEAPKPITPKLGVFFDVWKKPLSRSQVATVTVKPGQTMKVFVNNKPYSGDPRAIVLHAHTDVQIDIGPPFPAPTRFPYPSGV